LLPSLLPRMTMTSCLSTLTSVPLYLPKSTQSPTLTSSARVRPLSTTLSRPTAMTLPKVAFPGGGRESRCRRHLGLALDDHPIVKGTNGQYTSYVIDL
jgi:hypothetical protein